MKLTGALYTYQLKERKVARISKKIRQQKKIRGLYVICIPLFGDGVLEIYQYNKLLHPFYLAMSDDIKIVGFAKNMGEAQELLVTITQDLYDAGAFNLEHPKEYECYFEKFE